MCVCVCVGRDDVCAGRDDVCVGRGDVCVCREGGSAIYLTGQAHLGRYALQLRKLRCSVISRRKRIPVIVSSKQEEVYPQTLSLGVPPPHSWRISLQILSLRVQTLSLTVVSTTDVVAIVCSYFRIWWSFREIVIWGNGHSVHMTYCFCVHS